MWFKRMTLEEWFDDYQYEIDYDIGESAVKYLTLEDVGINLSKVPIRYGFHRGKPELRECIAEQHIGLSSDHVIVTSGASEAIFSVVSAIVKPGDHVVVEHPNFPALYEVPRSLNCELGLQRLRYENQFRPDLDELRRMLRPDTKMVSLTHPHNPTGSTITEQYLGELIDLVESHDIYLLFDETYREMAFASSLPPAAALSSKAISISSMSKSYGLPGIRIGWVATKNQFILDSVLAIREQVSITNNALGEEIALHVLGRKDKFLQSAKRHIERNRQVVSRWMDEQEHFEWVYPEAGVVSLPRIKPNVKIDPEKLYRLLAEKYKTFAIPGRCFEMDNIYFRLGFGATTEEIETGLMNINRALGDLM